MPGNVAEPVPPIISAGDGEVTVYGSAAKFCRDVEWIDVEDRQYRVWDSTGRPLIPMSRGRLVFLSVDGDSEPDPEELLGLLYNWVERVGAELYGISDLPNASLAELLAYMVDIDERTRKRRNRMRRWLAKRRSVGGSSPR